MIEFEVSNGRKLCLLQPTQNGRVEVFTTENYINHEEYDIEAGDFVMLLNLYRYIKDNNIQNDFINPDGKNHR